MPSLENCNTHWYTSSGGTYSSSESLSFLSLDFDLERDRLLLRSLSLLLRSRVGDHLPGRRSLDINRLLIPPRPRGLHTLPPCLMGERDLCCVRHDDLPRGEREYLLRGEKSRRLLGEVISVRLLGGEGDRRFGDDELFRRLGEGEDELLLLLLGGEGELRCRLGGEDGDCLRLLGGEDDEFLRLLGGEDDEFLLLLGGEVDCFLEGEVCELRCFRGDGERPLYLAGDLDRLRPVGERLIFLLLGGE